MVWRRCVAWRRNRELVRHNRWWWHLMASFLYLCFLFFVFVVFVCAYFLFPYLLFVKFLTAPGGTIFVFVFLFVLIFYFHISYL